MTIPTPMIDLPMTTAAYDYDNATPEVVSDWDMSAGDASAWTAINNATLSKVSNGEGGQALRITYNGTGLPTARQTVLGGNRNKICVRLRSNGTTIAKLIINGVEMYRTTTSTAWKEVVFNHYSAGTAIDVEATTSSASEYVEADIISAKTFASRTLDTIGTNHGIITGAETVTSQAEPIADKGFDNFTANRNLVVSNPNLTGIANHTISILTKNFKAASTLYIGDIWNGTNVFNICLRLSSGTFQYYCGGAGGANAANFAHVLDADWIHFVGLYDGSNTRIFINGVAGTNASGPVAPNVSTQDITLGGKYDGTLPWGNGIYGYKFWNSALTASQITELYHEERRSIGGLAIV